MRGHEAGEGWKKGGKGGHINAKLQQERPIVAVEQYKTAAGPFFRSIGAARETPLWGQPAMAGTATQSPKPKPRGSLPTTARAWT